MDLSDPTRAITPSLDGPILAVLAQAGHPLTVGEIAAQAARGSEIGIRRSVLRLVEQGIVTATQMGRNKVHELNRDHVAAPAAELLASLRLELWKRFRETLRRWQPIPVYACVFGSAARGDGGVDSDIDVLLVHNPFPGERRRQKGLGTAAGMAAELVASLQCPPMNAAQATAWQAQVDDLHTKVRRWTGNPLQVLDLSYWQWVRGGSTEPELLAEIDREAIRLVGAPIPRFGGVS